MILLENDSRQVKDETGKIRTVYRVFYENDVILGDHRVSGGSVGGYVESLENLHNVIIANNSIVLRDSVLKNCAVYGDSFISGGEFSECIFEGKPTIYGNSVAYNTIFSDSTTVKGNFKIDNSTLERTSYISGYGIIKQTTITGGGHIINGRNVDIENCRIEDTAEVTGTTKMKNSHLSGRAVVRDGNLHNQNLSYDYQLNVVQGKGEI